MDTKAITRLTFSNLAAQSAEQIGLAAAPLVAVLALDAGPAQTGLLQTAQTLPFLLLAIPAGLLADRTSRRRLMASAEALRALSLLGVLLLVQAGALTLPLLALLGFLGAAGTVAYSVAAPALVPALVPRALLAAANGRLELARSVAFTAGPAVAGALVGLVGAAPAFAAAAALSASAATLLLGLREPPRLSTAVNTTSTRARTVLSDLTEGARFTLTHTLLRPVLLTALVFNLAFFMLQAIYAPYAIHELGLTASGVGTTLAAYGLGMLLFALLARRIAGALPFGAVLAIGPLAGLTAAIVMALTIVLPSFWLAALSFFLLGAGPILWSIGSLTLRQAVTPESLLGRVSAIVTTATYGSRPLGAALGALIGGAYGPRTCLVVIAIGFLVQALVILGSPVPRLRTLPEPAAA